VDAVGALERGGEGAAPARSAPRPVSDPGPPHTYRIGAVSFAFSSEDEETRLRVESVLADCADAEAQAAFVLRVVAEAQGEMRLLEGGEELIPTSCSGEMAGAIVQAILEAANPGVDWLGLMHGAAIGRGGSAILLPGSSGSGKSTLAAYLCGRGADYLADDLIALAADGKVVPCPTRISAKRGAWSLLRPLYPVLDQLPEVVLLNRRIKFIPVGTEPWARPPQPVAGLVFPHWSEIDEPAVRALSPTEVLVMLVEERLWLGYPITEARLRRFLAWLPNLPAFSIRYGSLDQAERQLETLPFAR
jgi:hypothetical protein